MTYESILEPIKFKQEKQRRYAKVIDKLKDIREAQIAHKAVTGKYSNDFNALVTFIDTADFTITQRKDSLILDVEATKRDRGVEQFKDTILIDTIGTKSVKDSIFKNSDRYKDMMNVPGTDVKFSLKTDVITKKDIELSVFEASVPKDIILEDLPKYRVNIEKEAEAVDQVNGPNITVGSLEEVTTNGNWPRLYDENDKK